MLQELPACLAKLDRDKAFSLVQNALDTGEDPLKIIEFAQKGMEDVGEKYNNGEFYLAELILSGKIFETIVDMINPFLTQNAGQDKIGKIILATPESDIHDLGKNIVTTTFTANGWDVLDLGVNVPVEEVVSKTLEFKPDILGLSCLLSTAFDRMKRVFDSLDKEGLRNHMKFVIGGGVTNKATRDFVGADFQCTDVMDGLAYCTKIVGGK